ncbi:MAG: 50S ribosomal protein L9 [Candidatus Paceibacterota bacterium]|jgi:large subunit ribosomal protein L9
MKVIFLKDVPRVGKKYEVKNVADGFVKNMLLPKGLVELATEKAMSRVELLKKANEAEKQVRENLIMKNVGELGGVVITLKEKTNEKGHLFAGIHNAELVKALKEQTRIDIEPEFIILEKPIRETGEFTIPVKIHDKNGSFKLIVESL